MYPVITHWLTLYESGRDCISLLPSKRYFMPNTAEVFLQAPRVMIAFKHQTIAKPRQCFVLQGTSADHYRATGNSADRLRLVAQPCGAPEAWLSDQAPPPSLLLLLQPLFKHVDGCIRGSSVLYFHIRCKWRSLALYPELGRLLTHYNPLLIPNQATWPTFVFCDPGPQDQF